MLPALARDFLQAFCPAVKLRRACRLRCSVSVQEAWPLKLEDSAPSPTEEGGTLDRQSVQALREHIALHGSTDGSAHAGNHLELPNAMPATSAGQFVEDSADGNRADSRDAGSASAERPAEPQEKPQPARDSSSRAGGKKVAKRKAENGLVRRSGTQEPDWLLSSLSQKALRSGRTKSSSLVWSPTFLC